MTTIRLGYVAMSTQLVNASPSQTVTFAQFKQIKNKEAAIRKLGRVGASNLDSCIRILKHNISHDIQFFRLSSRLVPLVNHPEIGHWDYMTPLREKLSELKTLIKKHQMRVGFHPDHFVVLNSEDKEVFVNSLRVLQYHLHLLKGMGIHPVHRCVLHVGGRYNDKQQALETFIENWSFIPKQIQEMIILENDDTVFTAEDTLYLCEKLNIPMVFDYHHHLTNDGGRSWEDLWDRIVKTWEHSPLPVKMHISSPKTEKQPKAHHDYIDSKPFFSFLGQINGSVKNIDCMIEAKMKDEALFALMRNVKKDDTFQVLNGSTFMVK